MYEPAPRVIDAVQKLKGVFLEAPSTQMSLVDASRLSGLERNTTRLILEALEDALADVVGGLDGERDAGHHAERSETDHQPCEVLVAARCGHDLAV